MCCPIENNVPQISLQQPQLQPQRQPHITQLQPQQPPQVGPQLQPSQFSQFQTQFTANDLPIPGRCGTQAKERIVGGQETSILDYPW